MLERLPKILGTGLGRVAAPYVLRGVFSGYLQKVSIKEAVAWAQNGENLWDHISPEYQTKLHNLGASNIGRGLGPLTWLTSEWLIENLKEDTPALCSLFAGWPEGKTWLEVQIKDLRSKIESEKLIPDRPKTPKIQPNENEVENQEQTP